MQHIWIALYSWGLLVVHGHGALLERWITRYTSDNGYDTTDR